MRHWIDKFRLAFRGIAVGTRDQSSFAVHAIMSVAVVSLAALLNCSLWQWCVLLLCIGLVLSAELFNSSIEHLARGVCTDRNPHVGNALDVASGAVLFASLIASIVGLAIFAERILHFFLSSNGS